MPKQKPLRLVVEIDGCLGGGESTEWENSSYCECLKCRYKATVQDFTFPKPARKRGSFHFDRKNADQAGRLIIEPYRLDTRDGGADFQTLMTDALADLMHLCASCGDPEDFDRAVSVARIHYESER